MPLHKWNNSLAAQHCPPGRFFSLLIGAALLYLTSYTPLRRWLQRMAGLHPPPVAAQAAAAAAAAPQPGGRPPVAPPAQGTCNVFRFVCAVAGSLAEV